MAGRFAFKGDLPSLELVFREALRRHSVPKRVYKDNGAVTRSRHMKQVCARLGIHGIVFTKPYGPEGHGKIEPFNRFVTAAFTTLVATLDKAARANRFVHDDAGKPGHLRLDPRWAPVVARPPRPPARPGRGPRLRPGKRVDGVRTTVDGEPLNDLSVTRDGEVTRTGASRSNRTMMRRRRWIHQAPACADHSYGSAPTSGDSQSPASTQP